MHRLGVNLGCLKCRGTGNGGAWGWMEGAGMGFWVHGGVRGMAGLGNAWMEHPGWWCRAPGTGRVRMAAGVTRAWGMCGEQACYRLPQPLPLPRLDLSNCSLHSVPPGLAEATTAIVL